MMEWQPIETAPRDGTRIDLWMIDETGAGWREADAYYVTGRDDREVRYDEQRREFVTKYIHRDGWYAPNHGYEMDGWCDDPRHFNGHPLQMKWIFTEPTHWMPLPEAPSTPSKG